MSEPEPELDDEQADEPRRVVVTRRRAPKYRAFGVTGALAGILIGVALGVLRPIRGEYTEQAIVGYFATALGLIGALLGLGVALVAERRGLRR